MLQPIDKKKKLFIYLFLLVFLTTTNNLSLNNSELVNRLDEFKSMGCKL